MTLRHRKWLSVAAITVVLTLTTVLWPAWTGPGAAMAYSARSSKDNLSLLARLVCGEARGEPFEGKVAVAAVILNRTMDRRFPKTVAGVVYQPLAFESVDNGEIWKNVTGDCWKSAQLALRGWDPTNGSVFFFAPAKTKNKFIWSRPQTLHIGRHIFAK